MLCSKVIIWLQSKKLHCDKLGFKYAKFVILDFIGLSYEDWMRCFFLHFYKGNCFLHPINFDSHPTKILKLHFAIFTHLLTDFNIWKSFLYILDFEIQKVIFIFYLSFRKWIMSYGFSYSEWCVVNGVEDWDP